MQKILFLVAFLFSVHAYGQNLAGVWEGEVELNGDKKRTMKVRMELLESDSSFFGILYSRGLEKNSIYGCDYFVTVQKVRTGYLFKWQKVQRAVGMKESDCRLMYQLRMEFRQKDSLSILDGNWQWFPDGSDFISCTRVSKEVSAMAVDEINAYVSQLYQDYENLHIFLPVDKRLPQRVFTLDVSSQNVVVEFSTIDSSYHDSITVYVNESPVAEFHNLLQRPLRLRLPSLPEGITEIVIVSNSVIQNRLKVRMKIMSPELLKTAEITPGFTINPFVQLRSKLE